MPIPQQKTDRYALVPFIPDVKVREAGALAFSIFIQQRFGDTKMKDVPEISLARGIYEAWIAMFEMIERSPYLARNHIAKIIPFQRGANAMHEQAQARIDELTEVINKASTIMEMAHSEIQKLQSTGA